MIVSGAFPPVTVTVCVQLAVPPLLLVTVQVTVVTPALNCDGALLVTVSVPQPVVVGVPRFTLVA